VSADYKPVVYAFWRSLSETSIFSLTDAQSALQVYAERLVAFMQAGMLGAREVRDGQEMQLVAGRIVFHCPACARCARPLESPVPEQA
jgi:hypothetical protein